MVTRKDLNEIAEVFNSRLVLMQECIDSTGDIDGRYLEQAYATWKLANRMCTALKRLNPNVDYTKWNTAVLKNCKFSFIQ